MRARTGTAPTDGVTGNRAGAAGAGRHRSGSDREADAGHRETAPPSADLPIEHAEPPADGVGDVAAEALGASVTPARLRGDERGLPSVAGALPDYDQPHHLVRLRAAEPVAGDTDPGLRGDAAAAFTDTAVLVVVDGDDGGRLSVPYDSLTAVGRRGDAVVLDAGATAYRLLLPRAHDEDAAVEAAVSFLERELR
ncbi:hypothetical protein [Halobaculum litoreum]|uniref:Uncharacterized protein n=1 Tax=Halobaculum litoreum TaxID=3031998 RepID=A0ABD5XPT1_9EURY|nr:hypothetical protein [Halobaculum sp. DT92]